MRVDNVRLEKEGTQKCYVCHADVKWSYQVVFSPSKPLIIYRPEVRIIINKPGKARFHITCPGCQTIIETDEMDI